MSSWGLGPSWGRQTAHGSVQRTAPAPSAPACGPRALIAARCMVPGPHRDPAGWASGLPLSSALCEAVREAFFRLSSRLSRTKGVGPRGPQAAPRGRKGSSCAVHSDPCTSRGLTPQDSRPRPGPRAGRAPGTVQPHPAPTHRPPENPRTPESLSVVCVTVPEGASLCLTTSQNQPCSWALRRQCSDSILPSLISVATLPFQLIYLKIAGLLFPASDFWHPVVTPALLCLSQLLTKVRPSAQAAGAAP